MRIQDVFTADDTVLYEKRSHDSESHSWISKLTELLIAKIKNLERNLDISD